MKTPAERAIRNLPRLRSATWLAVALSGVLIIVCYGAAVQLPFFFDDLPVLVWVGGHDLADIWTTSSENAYYRPLTFTIYKLGLSLPKGSQQVFLHAINLLAHWANAVLIAQVVSMCNRRAHAPVRTVITAVSMRSFPFYSVLFPG